MPVRHRALIPDTTLSFLQNTGFNCAFFMLYVGVSQCAKLRGNLIVEWAVRPPVRSVAAFPDAATARAILPVCLTLAKECLPGSSTCIQEN
jgi:hypothetical protein